MAWAGWVPRRGTGPWGRSGVSTGLTGPLLHEALQVLDFVALLRSASEETQNRTGRATNAAIFGRVMSASASWRGAVLCGGAKDWPGD